MSTDYSRAARTSLDQEFTYLAIGMVAGAIPGIIVGFIVAGFAGHAAMWLSVFGGIGIVVGLIISSVLFRRRRARTAGPAAGDTRTEGQAPSSGRVGHARRD